MASSCCFYPFIFWHYFLFRLWRDCNWLNSNRLNAKYFSLFHSCFDIFRIDDISFFFFFFWIIDPIVRYLFWNFRGLFIRNHIHCCRIICYSMLRQLFLWRLFRSSDLLTFISKVDVWINLFNERKYISFNISLLFWRGIYWYRLKLRG